MELEDLDVTATLGVGGFGRVELVQVNQKNWGKLLHYIQI